MTERMSCRGHYIIMTSLTLHHIIMRRCPAEERVISPQCYKLGEGGQAWERGYYEHISCVHKYATDIIAQLNTIVPTCKLPILGSRIQCHYIIMTS